MTLAQIRRAFRRHGQTQAAFAREYGCTQSAVAMFFAGRSPSTPMYESALAKVRELEARATQTTAA